MAFTYSASALWYYALPGSITHLRMMLQFDAVYNHVSGDSKYAAFALLVSFIAIATGYLVFHRLFLSPLSRIPGPKLAAATFWYEVYYDAWCGGQFFKRTAELHRQYGPIIRINPDEVHFNDPDFIDTIYPRSGRKTDKPTFIAIRTGTPDSIVATIDHDVHRRRRSALNPFFSGASVRRLEPILRSRLEKLMSRLEESGKSGEIVRLHYPFKAYTSDVINEYAFGDSFHFLDELHYGKRYFDATEYFFSLTHIFAAFPWYARLVQKAPVWIVRNLSPTLRELTDKQQWWIDKVREIRNSPDPERAKDTIFQGILSSSLPDSDKADLRLAAEAQLVIFAGEGTTAYTLMSAVYELLAHPDELRKVRDELSAAIPDPDSIPTVAQLEPLPYFNAAIQEVLRLHPGVMNRQVRLSRDTPITYHDKSRNRSYVLPPGTVYSMSPLLMHSNPEVFQDPYEFRPERWIRDPELIHSFIGFSRGTRSCVGFLLAKREMMMVLATLFRKYDVYRGQAGPTLELYDTLRERDIDPNSDKIIPVPAPGSQGLRVRIRN